MLLQAQNCGYVDIALSLFTPQARNEAAKSREPVSLLDREAFIELLLENYEALEPEYKAQVPLTRVWIPTK